MPKRGRTKRNNPTDFLIEKSIADGAPSVIACGQLLAEPFNRLNADANCLISGSNDLI